MAGSGEPVEITALNSTLGLVTAAVTVAGPPQWFANCLVEKTFITQRDAQDILGTPGVPPSRQAGLLLDSVFTKIGASDGRRRWFITFVGIFSRDLAYKDLVEKLMERVEADSPQNQGEDGSSVQHQGEEGRSSHQGEEGRSSQHQGEEGRSSQHQGEEGRSSQHQGEEGRSPQHQEDASPQYQAVLQYKDQLARSLADGPDQFLLTLYNLRGWLGLGADIGASELIDVALTRISSNVSDYEVFIRMLPDTGAVKPIVDDIIEMYSEMCPLSRTAGGVGRPTLPELIRLKVPEGVGTHYTVFGVLLLNDETGSGFDIIRMDCHESPERICHQILREWLKGNGLPVTWETLVQTLRDSKLNPLADKVQAANIDYSFSSPDEGGKGQETSEIGNDTVGGIGRPTLPELIRLKVPEGVETHYTVFGIRLLDDATGNKVKRIEYEYHGSPEILCHQILRWWLRGNGLPVTWETLVRTLRDSRLYALADKVQAAKIDSSLSSPDEGGKGQETSEIGNDTVGFGEKSENTTPGTSPITHISSVGDGQLTLRQLVLMDVPQKVGENYSSFGMFLLNDKNRMAIIEHDYYGDTDMIVCEILKHWLDNCGSPYNIVLALRKCDLSAVAEEIEIAYPRLAQEETETHDPWTTETPISISGDIPSLPELCVIIPLAVSDKYDSFGKFLLNDETGDKMAEIKKKCGRKAMDITLEILRQWMDNSENVTWKSIISALRKCNLSSVADQIEMACEMARKSKELFEEAMKKGYVVVKLVKVIVVGPAGVGKTCLIYLLLGKDPPDKRHSTGCAERSIRVIRISKEGEEWSEVSNDEFEKIIAEAVPLLCEELKGNKVTKPEQDKCFSPIKGVGEGVMNVGTGAKTKEKSSGKNISSTETIKDAAANAMGENGSIEEIRGGSSKTSVDESGTEGLAVPFQQKMQKVVSEDVMKRFTQLVSGSDTSRRLLDMELIYLTDCGGQQAYWDLVPIFMRDTSATLFVHRLCEKLDEHPLNDLYQNDERVGPEERARLTTAQAFKTMLQGLCDEGKRSKIITVGTHKDLASDCEESPSQKNEKFVEISSQHFSNNIVYRNEGLKEVVFQVNTRDHSADDRKEVNKIKTSIEESAKEVKIPIWWFILQQILEQLSDRLKRCVFSKTECKRVSRTLGFSEEELDAALDFYDKLNIFVYKKDILRNVVFTDAKVPLDKLSELVEKQYHLKAAEADPAKAADEAITGDWIKFRDNGILIPNFLTKFPNHYVDEIFTRRDLLVLLEKLLIISKSSEGEYFFPAILNMTEDVRISLNACQVAPLVVEFPTGWAPPGVFCCSVCHLQTQAGWKIKKPTKCDTESSETPVNYISRNSITFTKRGRLGSVTLIDNFSFFAICVNVDIRKINGENLVRHCEVIKSEVFDAVKAGLRNTHHKDTSPKPAFVCPAHQNVVSSRELHVARIDDTMKYLICDKDTDISSDLSPRQTVWLGGPGPEVPQPQLVLQDATQKADIGEVSLSSNETHIASERQESDTSTTKSSGKVSGNVAMGDLMKLSTSKGRHIRILERSAMKYRDIGTILLKDDTGAIVTSIQQTALGNPVEAVRMIYERWIQENEDHSWKKLALCFRDVQLNPLARDIEQHFTLPSPTRSQAHPSHQIIGKADETVSEDDTKRGAQTSKSSGLKRSAGSATGSPSSTREKIRTATSLSQGLETKSPTPKPIGTQSAMKDTGSERDTASLLQSEGGRKRKRVTQPPNEPTPKRTERGEGKPLSHMLSQEREEGEFLGVGGARLEVVGRREVGEEGRLEGGGRTPSHHSLQLSDILREGRGTSSWCYLYMLCLVLFGIIGGIIFIAFGFNSVDPTPGLWQMKEPTLKELYHIKYIDTQGKNRHFRFIDSAQNDCEDLGIQLDIGPATIKGFRSMYDKPSDICREILLSWINKGEDATWAGLLRGLDRVPALGRVAKQLREALNSNYRDEL